MFTIKISNQDKDIISKYYPNKIITNNTITFNRKIDLDIFLDILSDLLCDKGLNLDDTPNDLGLNIENLIDKINREYWKQ